MQAENMRADCGGNCIPGAPVTLIANGLSISRLVVCGPIILALLRGTTLGDRVAFSLMAWAFLSDVTDGQIARRANARSRLGAVIDPVADKILIGSIVVTLVFLKSLPAWAAGLIVMRDLAILFLGALVLREKGLVLESTALGKATGVVFSLMIAFYTLELHPASLFMAYASAVFVIFSSISYTARLFRVLTRRV